MAVEHPDAPEYSDGWWRQREAEGRLWPHLEPSPPLTYRLRDALAGRVPGRALFAGSGASQDPCYLAAAGWQVTALDVSARALAIAHEVAVAGRPLVVTEARWQEGRSRVDSWRAPERDGGRLDYVTGGVLEAHTCAGPYDVIVCGDTLKHHRGESFYLLCRCLLDRLARDGALVVTVSNDAAARDEVAVTLECLGVAVYPDHGAPLLGPGTASLLRTIEPLGAAGASPMSAQARAERATRVAMDAVWNTCQPNWETLPRSILALDDGAAWTRALLEALVARAPEHRVRATLRDRLMHHHLAGGRFADAAAVAFELAADAVALRRDLAEAVRWWSYARRWARAAGADDRAALAELEIARAGIAAGDVRDAAATLGRVASELDVLGLEREADLARAMLDALPHHEPGPLAVVAGLGSVFEAPAIARSAELPDTPAPAAVALTSAPAWPVDAEALFPDALWHQLVDWFLPFSSEAVEVCGYLHEHSLAVGIPTSFGAERCPAGQAAFTALAARWLERALEAPAAASRLRGLVSSFDLLEQLVTLSNDRGRPVFSYRAFLRGASARDLGAFLAEPEHRARAAALDGAAPQSSHRAQGRYAIGVDFAADHAPLHAVYVRGPRPQVRDLRGLLAAFDVPSGGDRGPHALADLVSRAGPEWFYSVKLAPTAEVYVSYHARLGDLMQHGRLTAVERDHARWLLEQCRLPHAALRRARVTTRFDAAGTFHRLALDRVSLANVVEQTASGPRIVLPRYSSSPVP